MQNTTVEVAEADSAATLVFSDSKLVMEIVGWFPLACIYLKRVNRLLHQKIMGNITLINKLCGPYDESYGNPPALYHKLVWEGYMCEFSNQTYDSIKRHEKKIYQQKNKHLIRYIEPYQTLTGNIVHSCTYLPELFSPECIESTVLRIIMIRRRLKHYYGDDITKFDFLEFEKQCSSRQDIYDILTRHQVYKNEQYAIIAGDMDDFIKYYKQIEKHTRQKETPNYLCLIVMHNRRAMLDWIIAESGEITEFDDPDYIKKLIFTYALRHSNEAIAKEYANIGKVFIKTLFDCSDVVKSYIMAKKYGIEFDEECVIHAMTYNKCDLLRKLHADGVKLSNQRMKSRVLMLLPRRGGECGIDVTKYLWPEAFT